MMDIKARFLERFAPKVETWGSWQPQDHISRQDWQIAVEQLAAKVRSDLDQPEFKLTTSEVSIYYHKPLLEFARLISQKTGIALERTQTPDRMNGGATV